MQCIVEPVKHSHNRKSVLVLLGIPTDIQRWPCDWLLLSITSRNYVCSLAGQACENTPSKLWYLLYLFPEKAMAPHSSTLAWKILWTEEPGRLQSMGLQRVRHNWATSLSLFTSCIGEGNGNPLQCSCLENPRDGGTWWAAVSGSHRVRHDWSDLTADLAKVKKNW